MVLPLVIRVSDLLTRIRVSMFILRPAWEGSWQKRTEAARKAAYIQDRISILVNVQKIPFEPAVCEAGVAESSSKLLHVDVAET